MTTKELEAIRSKALAMLSTEYQVLEEFVELPPEQTRERYEVLKGFYETHNQPTTR